MKREILIVTMLLTNGFSANDDIDFLQTLEEVTQIATKTKLNIDYVPGTVTIIYGEDLKARGVTNLAELNSYDMVIGMESSVSSLRGVGAMYGANGNKIKWLLNGKVIESELKETDDWGKGTLFIPIPIDFVDRVEFIRGAGSAIYGGNAIFGVINIITKKSENGVFIGYEYLGENNNGKHTGVYLNFESENLSLNFGASKYLSDGYDLYVKKDGNFHNHIDGGYAPAYGPGELPANHRGYTLLLDLTYQKFDIWAYRLLSDTGQGYVDWYPTDTLPPNDKRYVKSSIQTMFGLKREFNLNDLTITPEFGGSIYENPADRYYKWPVGFLGFMDEKFRSREYREQKSYGKVDFKYRLDSHTLNSGVFFQKTDILEDRTFRNYVLREPEVVDWFEHTGLLKTKDDRVQKALYIQDIFDINSKSTLTLGVRYDNFSDVSSAYSPRVAGVYRVDDSNILKFQYSKSFRAPSFFEAYGYMSPYVLEPEVVDTLEAGYIYKDMKNHFRATIFKSKMKNMIIQHYKSYYFENLKEIAEVEGLELEYRFKRENFEIDLNGALYNTHNRETSNNFSLSSKFMGNVNLKYSFKDGDNINVWYH